jgi:hypothetical protein
LGLGGPFRLSFDVTPYILEKNPISRRADFYEVQSAAGIAIFVFVGCRIPISTPERGF